MGFAKTLRTLKQEKVFLKLLLYAILFTFPLAASVNLLYL